MLKFKKETSQAWLKAKREVPCIKYERPRWTPKYPLKHKLPEANEVWSREKWETSGFSKSSIPTTTSTMLNTQKWDELIEELETEGKMSHYFKHELKKVKEWLTEGIPYRMTGPGTKPGKAKHNLNEIETEMAVDKLAQFCVQGHVAGPLFDWENRKDLKFIKTFARYQASDNSVRIINDHSWPKGRAFN